jgi:hypothetical protein
MLEPAGPVTIGVACKLVDPMCRALNTGTSPERPLREECFLTRAVVGAMSEMTT